MVRLVIDNDVYNRVGESWWEEGNPLNLLHGSLTPARFDYFRAVLGATVGRDVSGLRALDVGSGGGFLAEEFTRIGFRVTGIDPSPVSVETARRHAAGSALDIEYRIGSGERLPVPDAAFDIVYCCDVLEHVSDLDAVIAETSRALKPGGLYLFDTINRTVASKLVAIKIMQEWRMTRMFDTPIHDWSMCIRPAELTSILDRHGLRRAEIVGLGPRSKNPLRLLDLARAGGTRLSYGELSRRLDFGQIRSTAISYMGYAVKNGESPPRQRDGLPDGRN
ncbi:MULTISPECIES: bifunctional 2-polyprenyl-6-hydroxyphenol methylase/3-demethylubiquinol 3-O-methyltransferase UbiG [unclassified Rhodococcus (in: high G+C Gram-positive bacteria)]|uniref:bifunctional 2-polyprenyl-6-hydroxyphenol methylase/3-demethylubiquinol 3-O-methyltransferase UbiG n=1 Tax=unclassified Rhodococcus (in: high G+C Gram-positive bacteria) TaxID=192944 RepID=UPI00163B063D|nr:MULTISPECIES: bifunctional 2-polyprenyl-6-hydroxyphenol methylase/3-demethylubiquinol 3-O-methyltransferase UbiG [unclassified Rhodococcus (in: high G+C Gram-positive bacteria)]MBC2642451.1 3-demethylubiquinone-9 3-O-methyltransferase [Rhodococcus sp. 3A]MBC2892806.1 3-demethylubiquinone-9 3-O-methyltransferase [Rhodococcus sp. 4CII]